ncbi:sigma factor-like helix-turn-helix DNA-binding protein [Myroides fluvii]|uniref:sigma factor-like helix-turn-helix DNA-binding protein n=1 Tax=Myroides fluvii TaxID=2572594 RepID=UPI0018EED70F|nr:sigma factor-like helix-turn-helix DNA-binding protein [Myroides fluvii]
MKNIGKKSIPELENYISIIKDFIANVNESADERQLIILKNNFLIQRTFSLPQIPNEILESEYIFLLTNFLLDKNVLFTENQTIILKQALKIYQGEKELNLEEIAERNNLTRERVRQIRKTCIEELSNKLLFIKSFNDNLFQNYGLDLSANLLEIKENIVNRVNTLNRTNFSKEFIGYILAVYLSDDFYLLGNIEDLLLPKFSNSRSRHN